METPRELFELFLGVVPFLRPRFEPALGAEVAAGLGVVVALVLRFAWTLAEVVVALALYFFSRPPERPADA